MDAADRFYGWAGAVARFLDESPESIIEALQRHHLLCMNGPADQSQQTAWRDSIDILRSQFSGLVAANPESGNWGVILEYVLPRERGRRPDVIVLTGEEILVLEFKGRRPPAMQAHLDQTDAYARDLRHYHAGCRRLPVHPVLVLAQARGACRECIDTVHVVGPGDIAPLLNELGGCHVGEDVGLDEWLAADYAPLPSLVSAARTIFEHEPLPNIRRATSAGIPECIESLLAAAREAESRKELHLALITGVPGAGKTLVGLQFVYAQHFGDEGGNRTAVFLSGNGPLVKVLQHALKSSVFVQDVHGFLMQYGGSRGRAPEEHVWVYDEAQRAWDADRVRGKRGVNSSEPEDFLRLGVRMDSWALMVGLIGEGQEIHLGEEAGLAQWDEAIAKSGAEWTVHCPSKVASVFQSAHEVRVDDDLDLNTSLRSHFAEDVQEWISLTLDGNIEAARGCATRVHEQGFDMYLTRDLTAAKDYALERYRGQEDKRFGLLASSKAKNASEYGVHNEYNFTKNLREGPWYNDPQDSPRSCCALHDVATEFACQGLELDLPIITWGDDLLWVDERWKSRPQPRSSAHDPHRLRINSYRVLLSRGRDGFVLFVPPEARMDAVADVLLSAGVRTLRNVVALAA